MRSNSNSKVSGIAIFMVISAVAMLSVLVTEFVYIAQVNQAIAYGGLDQLKALALSKAGLKISLLRLKAYQQANAMAKTLDSSGVSGVSSSLLQQIWSLPFVYPIPELPGMGVDEKAALAAFHKETGLEGSFTAQIESESSRLNLNAILPEYASPLPTPSASAPAPVLGSPPTPQPTPSFNAETAREGLYDSLNNEILQRSINDVDFAGNYRDFRTTDFLDALIDWADFGYTRRTSPNQDPATAKRAPFYSVSELHMLPLIDDTLYDLFAPSLTVASTPGVNVNTMRAPTIRALLGVNITDDQIQALLDFRDSQNANNQFSSGDAFYTYLQEHIPYFQNAQNIANLKQELDKKNIRLLTDETRFKITVRAEVNSAVRTLEAWVNLDAPTRPAVPSAGGSSPSSATPPNAVTPSALNAGITLTYIQIH